jgi:hypothetical protein
MGFQECIALTFLVSGILSIWPSHVNSLYGMKFLFILRIKRTLVNAATMQICRPFSLLRSANKRDPFFRLFVFMHISTRLSWRDSRKILHSEVLREIVEPFHFWLKSNNLTDILREGTYIYIHCPPIIPCEKQKKVIGLSYFYILHCFGRTRGTFSLLDKHHDVKIHAWVTVQLHDLPTPDPLPPNVIYIYIYMSYRTANFQMLHFKYLFNKCPYWIF